MCVYVYIHIHTCVYIYIHTCVYNLKFILSNPNRPTHHHTPHTRPYHLTTQSPHIPLIIRPDQVRPNASGHSSAQYFVIHYYIASGSSTSREEARRASASAARPSHRPSCASALSPRLSRVAADALELGGAGASTGLSSAHGRHVARGVWRGDRVCGAHELQAEHL